VIYVVLGMHKSGTTLASQILHHSGVNMGDNLENGVSYDQGNQYERESTWRLNEDILQARNQRSVDIHASASLQLSPEQRVRMRQIIANCNQQYPHWGFKDPRTCLVYPLWAAELPAHKLIVIYRDPTEPWPRYRPRHVRNRYREPVLAWKYLQSWCEHNLRILSYLQTTTQPYIVLDYQRLVTTQIEFERLEQFLGIPLADRRRPSLYRNRPQTYPVLSFAGWLLDKKKSYQPQSILRQFEDYRQ
jgi:hypothetical protein